MICRRVTLNVATALALVLGAAALSGCGNEGEDLLEEGLRLYRQNKLQEALPVLERAAEAREDDAEAHAWLAETYRRLDEPDKAAKAARTAIDLDPCNSFAHVVLAWNYNPMYGLWPGINREMSWKHLMKAAECDSTDGNVWPGVWIEALRRGDSRMEKRSLRRMVETGFLTPAVLAYNRWMLRDLPENALLITNGDWDTFPAVALQQVEAFRPDVAVVNRSLLNTAWYPRYLRDHYGLALPFSEEELPELKTLLDASGRPVFVSTQIFRGWLEMRASGEMERPIAISVTVDLNAFGKGLAEDLSLAGPFWLWRPSQGAGRPDTALIAQSLEGVEPADFSGPFVSPEDRSPIRIKTSATLVHNISAAGLKYARSLLEAGRTSEAREMISWVESFEKETSLGLVSEELIAELRREIGE